MASPLDSLLNPRSLAIIGASPDHSKLRGRLGKLVINNDYAGKLYFINPNHRSINGQACLPSIAAVPEPVDLAIILIPAQQALSVIEACAVVGVRNAAILASGFAEEGSTGQRQLQRAITDVAHRSGMRVLGPNAEGFHNEINHVSATFSPAVDVDPAARIALHGRRCGIIAQSGGMGFSLYHSGCAMGLAFSYVVTTGNEADLNAAEVLDFMAGDPDTAVIILFLEAVRDPAAFRAAAQRAAEANKPVVVIKVGRSEAGGRATVSHTGAMAGWDAAYDAFFRHYGMTVVKDPRLALAAAAAFATCPLPRGRRAAVLTTSGGGGALLADALSEAGFELPELAADTQTFIRSLIPSWGATRNPVDMTGGSMRNGAALKMLERLGAGNEVDVVAVALTGSNADRPPLLPEAQFKALLAVQRLPVLIYTYTVPSTLARRAMADADTLLYDGIAELALAAAALVERAAFSFEPAAEPRTESVADAELERMPAGVVPEALAKDLLRRLDFPVPRGRLVTRAAELQSAAAGLNFPLAVKIQSPDIAHKTEAGGVRLGIADAAALPAAYAEVMQAAQRSAAGASITGVLLEQMAPPGIELIVGVLRDRTFGPVLTVGAGGVAAELQRDVARALAPLSATQALELLKRLRIYPLLAGYRGSAPADLAALSTLLARVSALAAGHSDRVAELELNPVIVHAAGQGCSIVDALLVIEPYEHTELSSHAGDAAPLIPGNGT